MQIDSAGLSFASLHQSASTTQLQESLRVQLPDPAAAARPGDAVVLSGRVPDTQGARDLAGDDVPTSDDEVKLAILQRLLEQLTGRTFDTKALQALLKDLRSSRSQQPAAAPPPGRTDGQRSPDAPRGAGFVYDFRATHVEQESLAFSASGVIQTTDGRQIRFEVSLSMSRTFMEEHAIHVEGGDTRALKDPLVVNLGGGAATLTASRFAFDLDSDGVREEVPLVGGGAGLLGIDRNGNGRIDNGGELFGPTSGNGFAELSALDEDGNGWVDGGDAGYGKLVVWFPGSDGNGSLSSAASLGIGAIGTTSQASPFSIRDEANQVLGQVRSTGIYVNESGGVGTIQQVDLTA